MMTYEEALSFLNAPKYSATRPGLGPVSELMKRLGNPEKHMKYVHITGTNGKGSTAAFIESALRESGYRTGLYTSPFIERFTERIRVCGEEIPEDDLARLTEMVREASLSMLSDGLTEPTVFEMVTAVAFLYFLERKCDIVVLEVGMGGRLDATNIIPSSEVSVITRIAMDHMEFLGNTLAEIAYEKAGIIRENGITVTCREDPEAAAVIEKTCRERSSRLVTADASGVRLLKQDLSGQEYSLPESEGTRIQIRKLGTYQIQNSLTAYTALEQMKERWPRLTEDTIHRGLLKAEWPGRLELMREDPVFLIDGAHNPNGVEALTESLRTLFPGEKFVFVAGVLKDKDYPAMFQMTDPLALRYFTVTPDSPRALPAEELRDFLRERDMDAESFDSVEEAARTAWNLATEPSESGILEPPKVIAFGSLYYIGELRKIIRRLPLRT
ncbi:MAG: bifunctional folylpolyglutamate synthase/dihydrofolate synthase [Eubacteriales bacterium]|nr:bifunctional folylpolyglutamate synthase/dihydrofolate synthase [Eubacteriales bacterium]